MIRVGTCVELLDGSTVTVGPMVCKTYLGDCPVFECETQSGVKMIPMYEMKTEMGEAYRESAKKMLQGHQRLLRDIGCLETIKECLEDYTTDLICFAHKGSYKVTNGQRIVGFGTDEQSAWLSVFENIL